MNDYFYLKAGLFSNDRNSVKKSFVFNARTPFFYRYDVPTDTYFPYGFLSSFTLKSSSGFAMRARAFFPYHYLVNPPFW